MNSDDLDVLKRRFEAFETIVPREGGHIQIVRGPDKSFVGIVGDRIALIRLATAILKYAIQGHDATCDANERALVLDNFFTAPSPTRDFMVQIDDPFFKSGAPKPHSTFKLIRSLLFKKK